ncbi:MAG: hypothetical protein HPY50_04680 [Firmicutes bacterium]|nr:hypothetical protein [Bacillota bacterium]
MGMPEEYLPGRILPERGKPENLSFGLQKAPKPTVEMANLYKMYDNIRSRGLSTELKTGGEQTPVSFEQLYKDAWPNHSTFSEEWLRDNPSPVVKTPTLAEQRMKDEPYGVIDTQGNQLPGWLDKVAKFLEPASQAQEETGGGLGGVIPPGYFDQDSGWITLPSKIRTAGFILRHPVAANRIGYADPKKGKTDITNNAIRFSTNNLGFNENKDFEGSQVNAFRHVLWQAAITKELGPQTALEAGYAHEDNPDADLNKRFFSTRHEADQAVDLLNNVIGRQIGKNIQSNDMRDIARATLKYYAEHGLYVAKERIDGGTGYVIAREYLSYPQYKAAFDRLGQLDSNGYAQEDKKPN